MPLVENENVSGLAQVMRDGDYTQEDVLSVMSFIQDVWDEIPLYTTGQGPRRGADLIFHTAKEYTTDNKDDLKRSVAQAIFKYKSVKGRAITNEALKRIANGELEKVSRWFLKARNLNKELVVRTVAFSHGIQQVLSGDILLSPY